ncbi:hypothetical protein F4810DRAFT_640519 [Camillea tinctor]|nr:hypothetical protein F4810DRAFT_640519 [Camillea tinctor]
MASNIDLKMDAQESQTAPSADRLESNISHTEDTKTPCLETNPSAPSAEATKQRAGEKGTKKTGRKCSKKAKKAKSHKSKPVSSDSSSSESEDDDGTNLSSDESSDSESESVVDLKKKRAQKKRQENRGTTKKSSQKPKKTKKHAKSTVPVENVDTTDSGSDDDHDDESDSNDGSPSSTKKSEIDQLKQQVQEMKRQMNTIFSGAGSINNAIGLGGGALGPGHLASGGIGLNAGYPLIGGGAGGSGLNALNANGLDINRLVGREAIFGGGNIRRPANRRGNPNLGKDYPQADSGRDGNSHTTAKGRRGKKEVAQRLDFKRVDHVWDSQLHNYKLQDTAEASHNSQYDEYLFHVRRTFDWEGKYKATVVDIKSKQLREALQDVIGNIKGVSLVDETPKLDPNMLFLYLEDMRSHLSNLKKLEPKGETHKERKKAQKWIDDKRRHLKVLVKYLDKDYAQIKKSLYPMLDNGLITFDLLWALWKPNTLVYTTMYGSADQPRAFKVEVAEKHYSVLRGEFYYVEGKYFEYDGKQFGYGSMSQEIPDFRGARKITSLSCYPLKYHKNESQLRKDLIERGKKFVSLGGVHYKSHQGMAYYKKKKSIIKVNINGRIMVDPAIHRRINPNYPVSLVRPKDHDVISDDEDDSEAEGDCCSDSEEVCNGQDQTLEDDEEDGGKVKLVTKVFEDNKGNVHTARIPKNLVSPENPKEKLDKVRSKEEDDGEKASREDNEETADGDEEGSADKGKASPPAFSDEEYLIASPVVLGFAFPEKLWLEFTVSGVKEISWNEGAYDSLVLEPKTKDIVKALVESHKYHAAESIDDVIQGKGKGLVTVLHGPPGTGKTLTAEGISELLKCPLYMVSAGDLGTDSRYLEAELQKILDICHAWGAILLLDEADVFLEKRNMQDIHRNALVSIFLRQLEYFQGILFLTTNRVQTFDDAFQSRIHIALPYKALDIKAKKAVFRIFIERARQSASNATTVTNTTASSSQSSSSVTPSTSSASSSAAKQKTQTQGQTQLAFTEADYSDLARHDLNGRQIKNTVLTAQALAVQQGEPLSMRHIRQVLDVQQTFERDLRGGPGYQEAMRNYY